MDYRILLEKFMTAVIEDDPVVAERCANIDLGVAPPYTDEEFEELKALWQRLLPEHLRP